MRSREQTSGEPFSNVQRIPALEPLQWVRKGYQDLRANPMASLFYGLCFVLGGYLLVWVLRESPEYIAGVTTGFLIVGPLLAMGLYQLSRCREQGTPCSLMSTLTVWRNNLGQLSLFGLLLLLIYLVWARAALVVFALFYSGELPGYEDLFAHLLRSDNTGFLLAYLGVASLFALITFSITLVSIPMMLDRGTDAISAALTSTVALLRNPEAMMLWAGIIATLTALGLSTLFLGLLVIGPLLGHATWHAYRALIDHN